MTNIKMSTVLIMTLISGLLLVSSQILQESRTIQFMNQKKMDSNVSYPAKTIMEIKEIMEMTPSTEYTKEKLDSYFEGNIITMSASIKMDNTSTSFLSLWNMESFKTVEYSSLSSILQEKIKELDYLYPDNTGLIQLMETTYEEEDTTELWKYYHSGYGHFVLHDDTLYFISLSGL